MPNRWRLWALGAFLSFLALGGVSGAGAAVTTETQTITGNAAADYSQLSTGPGWARVTRQDLGQAKPGREARRRSLLYFGQLTDFQLADEESPARVEFLDVDSTPFTAAWRPQEEPPPGAPRRRSARSSSIRLSAR